MVSICDHQQSRGYPRMELLISARPFEDGEYTVTMD
jgi:hypothetical protein